MLNKGNFALLSKTKRKYISPCLVSDLLFNYMYFTNLCVCVCVCWGGGCGMSFVNNAGT